MTPALGVLLQKCRLFGSSGILATLAAMRRASSLVSRLAAVRSLPGKTHVSERRIDRRGVTAVGHYTPNEWELGVSHPG